MLQRIIQLVEGVDDIIGNSKIPSGFVNPSNAESRIAGFFNLSFTIATILATFFVIKGGLDYIMSSGDSGKVKLAQAEIQYALIGLVVALSGFIVVRVVTNALGYEPGGLFG